MKDKFIYRSLFYSILFLLINFIFISCLEKNNTDDSLENIKQQNKKETLFKKISSAHSGLTFANQIKPNFRFNILEYNYFYNGGGIATADFNNDGLTDLFFGGNMVSSAFYINKGNLKFDDVTSIAGLKTQTWISGVSVIDINADGLLDLYLCVAGYPEAEKRKNLLYINKGIEEDGTPKFEEEAGNYGLDDSGYSSQAAFFDYDRDGDLDVYIATVYHDKLNPNLPRPKVNDGTAPSTDKLYENLSEKCKSDDCQIRFKDVSKEAGILKEGYGLGIAINDFNRDGWPDVFVSNDFVYNDLLYINNKNGTFTDKADKVFRHQSQFSMGTDVADINHDALPDIVVLDMLPETNLRQKQMNIAMNYDRFSMALDNGYLPQYSRNTLQLHQGMINEEPQFSEIGMLAGIYQTDWSWSPLFADFDMDGHLDLFVSNGIPKDITDSDFIKYRDQKVMKGNFNYDSLVKDLLNQIENLPSVDKSNYIFKNGGNLRFQDVTNDWGLSEPSLSNGAITADLDNDGDLDIVTNNLDKEVFLYENTFVNTTPNTNFLKFKLQGAKKNKWGVGSQIKVTTTQKEYNLYYHPIHGFQSSNLTSAYVSLGIDTLVKSIQITWPDGKIETQSYLAINKEHTFDYNNASTSRKVLSPLSLNPLLTSVKDKIKYYHKENYFIDYKFEPLLTHQYSKQGPAMAVADVDGNGLDDIFIGGAVKLNGQLYLQQSNGGFKRVTFPDENYEDTGALFFDADQDGDIDLYVVSGGNEYNPNTAPYQDRLYLNDGKGNFEKAKGALPPLYSSGNAIVALDYDQDGDKDVFVGGRVVPGNYPIPSQSVLLQNNGGKFIDVSQQVFPTLKNLGLVTDVLVTDFNKDQKDDLLIAGEFMPLTFLQNEKGNFKNVTPITGIGDQKGWWFSLAQGDFDKDGDIDYVAGNLGFNTKFKASKENPIVIKATDFNKDGSLDILLGYYLKNEQGELQLFPYHSRDVLADKIRLLKREFPSYISFSKASYFDVLSKFKIEKIYSAEARYMQSSYVENLGNGKFKLHSLPIEAQYSPINSLLIKDFNEDGSLDILSAGNSYTTEFTSGWYDASNGLLLLGDGKGNFKPLSIQESGFFTTGETREMVLLKNVKGEDMILVGRNSLPLLVFE